MSIDVPELADLEQVRGRWRTAVAGVLSKSARKDPAQLGDEPEQLLETPTSDGIAIRALYTGAEGGEGVAGAYRELVAAWGLRPRLAVLLENELTQRHGGQW